MKQLTNLKKNTKILSLKFAKKNKNLLKKEHQIKFSNHHPPEIYSEAVPTTEIQNLSSFVNNITTNERLSYTKYIKNIHLPFVSFSVVRTKKQIKRSNREGK